MGVGEMVIYEMNLIKYSFNCLVGYVIIIFKPLKP